MDSYHVVVVGGGFGGLQAVQQLKSAPIRITLIDARNFHLFQPLLYQVATGGLSPANIATPLRSIFKRQANVQVLLGRVTDIDVEGRRVLMAEEAIGYDALIVATGSSHSYFGHEAWGSYAPGLKTVEDALAIRRRILLAFEAAEHQTDPERIKALLTFVIVGGGPTGVELAGALSEISNHTLQHEFRNINPADARIILVDHGDRVLKAYAEDLSASATKTLERLEVTVRTGAGVTQIGPDSVTIEENGKEEVVPTHSVFWAAGVKASPLGKLLSERTGAELDHAGRVQVQPDLSLQGHPEIYVIGDLAHCPDASGNPLPGVAQVAIQQGKHAAQVILQRREGKPIKPFRYHDLGSMATIGRSAAVVQMGRLKFSGFFAWVAWLFVHLMSLVRYESRALVLLQWSWSYFTWNRAASLITGEARSEDL
ncbi:MAG: NAD(P)/FAD-dependent oxidoreductase [Candidatus Hydrogenedens sp.]|nr:NAD(P)/FAD-dependent oxidoreductase [Candidatus Hydrogenedens sp.]